MTKNKVQYNMKNVHYAPLTVSVGESVTYGVPIAIPGAVNISVSPEGDKTEFYADGVIYFSRYANSGYTGDIEIALLPESFLIDILGEEKSTADKVLVENSNASPQPFALLFEFDGDARAVRRIFYNCTASRPNIEGETNQKGITPKTQKLSFSAQPLPDGMIKANTGDETSQAVYNDWYKSVWLTDTTEGGK